MAERSENSADIQETLAAFITEVRGQKRVIENLIESKINEQFDTLKNEIRGNSVAISGELKKLKTSADFKWKREGNRIQFELNSEILTDIRQAKWGVENNKIEYTSEVLEEIERKIQKRNKLIQIADSSEGGWETVRQYEARPVASDSEDDRRIARAENRAIKRKKAKKGNFHYKSFNERRDGNNNNNFGSELFPGHQMSSRTQQSKNQSFRAYGSCFSCGYFGHFRKDCPNNTATRSFRGTTPSATDGSQKI